MKTRPLIRNAVVLGAGVMLALLLAAASARSQTPPRLALPIDCQPGNTCFVQNYVDHWAGASAAAPCRPTTGFAPGLSRSRRAKNAVR